MKKEITLSDYVYSQLEFLEMGEDFINHDSEALKYLIKKCILTHFHKDKINPLKEGSFSIKHEINGNNESILYISVNDYPLIIKRNWNNTENWLSLFKDKFGTFAEIKYNNGEYHARVYSEDFFGYYLDDYKINGSTFRLSKNSSPNMEHQDNFNEIHKNITLKLKEFNNFEITENDKTRSETINIIPTPCSTYGEYTDAIFNEMEKIALADHKERTRK